MLELTEPRWARSSGDSFGPKVLGLKRIFCYAIPHKLSTKWSKNAICHLFNKVILWNANCE